MARLFNFDYRSPFYYLVTIKRLPGRPPLAILKADAPSGVDPDYPLTRVLQETLRRFRTRSPGIESISPYAIMPDHIHLLVKLGNDPKRLSLPQYMSILIRALTKACWTQQQLQTTVQPKLPQPAGLATGAQPKPPTLQTAGLATGASARPLPAPRVFEPEWHDLIVKKANQLAHFREYIKNNPKMALLRRQHRNRFHCYRDYHHWRLEDLPCDLVGNPELLDEPAFLAVRISRSVQPGSDEWQKLERFYGAWRPSGTAVGTWWSKGEQMAYRRILENGGNVIVLSPDGFGERWHPTGEDAQRFCAEGRLLYVSPYPYHTAKLPVGETRRRCLALNELAHAMATRARP